MGNYISRCLKSLSLLDYPREMYEIIVIDNGSTDNTRKICENFSVKYIFEERRNRGHARNVGIKHSKGDIIAFVDADCEVRSDWLKFHVRNHAKTLVGAVGGAVINPYLDLSNKFATAIYVESSIEFVASSLKRFIYHLPGCNSSFKKFILKKVGFFDNLHVGEDFLLSRKIIDLGFKLLFDPAAKVLHYGTSPNMSTRSFIAKEIEMGQAYFYCQIRNKKLLGRLPTQRFFVLLLIPSIISVRILRQIYKLKYLPTLARPLLIPCLIMGGIVWGFSYAKEALFAHQPRAA
jgi:cellulose synthase/poly-beta-1,6-N-acetylglucosamine synthase-like glycosyltransferase